MKSTIFRVGASYGAVLLVYVTALAPAHATLENFDSFNYSGTALSAQSGGTGWSGAWTITAATDNSLSNDSVSLSYPVTFESPLTTPATSGSRVVTGGLADQRG